jgi:hypothetical protein
MFKVEIEKKIKNKKNTRLADLKGQHVWVL